MLIPYFEEPYDSKIVMQIKYKLMHPYYKLT
jgi:hypothetical protein